LEARSVADPTAFVVIECNPILLPTLKSNRDRNGCQFEIEPVAIAYGGETVSFTIDGHFMMGRLQEGAGQRVTVKATTMKSILDRKAFKKINLISDCEGAEIDLVLNEPDVLRERVKWLVIETHEMHVGAAAVKKMLDALSQLGFVVRDQARETVLALENLSL
jgi:FkbM family methyltransferase